MIYKQGCQGDLTTSGRRRPCQSDQPHPLQAGMPVLADDDVVVHASGVAISMVALVIWMSACEARGRLSATRRFARMRPPVDRRYHRAARCSHPRSTEVRWLILTSKGPPHLRRPFCLDGPVMICFNGRMLSNPTNNKPKHDGGSTIALWSPNQSNSTLVRSSLRA